MCCPGPTPVPYSHPTALSAAGSSLLALCYLLMCQMFCRAHLEMRMFEGPGGTIPFCTWPHCFHCLPSYINNSSKVSASLSQIFLLLPALLLVCSPSASPMEEGSAPAPKSYG